MTNTVTHYVTYKGHRYEVDTHYKTIHVVLPRVKGRLGYQPAVKRELNWMGATAFKVRAQLAWEQAQLAAKQEQKS